MTDIPKASPIKPASANQLATVATLCRLLKLEDTCNEAWTSLEASEEITRLSRIYNDRKPRRGRR